MPDFRVVMRGAVCHIGDGPKTHAVLLRVSQAPTIRARAEDRADGGPAIDMEIPAGATVEFQGIPAGTATPGPQFQNLVPSIKPLLRDADETRKELHPDIRARANHARVAAYLIYANGALRGRRPHLNKIKFHLAEGNTPQQCVASETAFIAANLNNPVTLIIRPTTGQVTSFQLRPSATVEIDNRDTNGGFRLYRELTQASRIVPVTIGSPCTATGTGENPIEPGPRAFDPPGPGPGDLQAASADLVNLGFPNPECTNSGWP